jgi:hypothetical protein
MAIATGADPAFETGGIIHAGECGNLQDRRRDSIEELHDRSLNVRQARRRFGVRRPSDGELDNAEGRGRQDCKTHQPIGHFVLPFNGLPLLLGNQGDDVAALLTAKRQQLRVIFTDH